MKKGLTLIELVVSISIIIMLTAFGIPAFSRFGTERELIQAAELVAGTIREAQAMALAPQGGHSSYLAEFVSPSRITVRAKSTDGSKIVLKETSLQPKITFATPSTWTFNVNDQGRLEFNQDRSLTLAHSKLNTTKTITGHGATGLIEIR